MKKQPRKRPRKPYRKHRRKVRPPKVSYEFTELDLTAFGGSSILARTAQRFGLFELLSEAVSVKVRDRGASDAETSWSMIRSLARGHGALSDPDALRADSVARKLLGLRRVPESRRGSARPHARNLLFQAADRPFQRPEPGRFGPPERPGCLSTPESPETDPKSRSGENYQGCRAQLFIILSLPKPSGTL